MIFYINNYEIIIDTCLPVCQLRHKIFACVYNNDKKRFYLGLTLLGISVTIQKNKRRIKQ